MTSEHQGFILLPSTAYKYQLRTMAKVSADFLHKNKTAEITVCAFKHVYLAFF
jgi:hypothetical protein